MSLLSRLRDLFDELTLPPGGAVDDTRLTVAALLVLVARVDGTVLPVEEDGAAGAAAIALRHRRRGDAARSPRRGRRDRTRRGSRPRRSPRASCTTSSPRNGRAVSPSPTGSPRSTVSCTSSRRTCSGGSAAFSACRDAAVTAVREGRPAESRTGGGRVASDVIKAPVLIILHQEHSTPGRVGRLLLERGHPLDIRRPRFGDPLPETLAGHAGAVIFGGPMSANDPDDFVKQEIDWIGVPLREQQALPRPLPRRADAGKASRRLGLGASRRARRDRLLSARPDGGRSGCGGALGRRLAEPCLPLAPGGLRLSFGRRDACDGRRLPDPGDRRRHDAPSACSSTRK